MPLRKSSGTRSSENDPVNDVRPHISGVSPAAAIPGGDFQIRGAGLTGAERAYVRFGTTPAHIVVGSEAYVVAL